MNEDPKSLRIPVVRVDQPIGEFYVGMMAANDLVAIADFDVRRISDGEGIETYLGIQRELNKTRVKEIRQYVEGPDATFPTAVVLAVEERAARLEPACEGSQEHFWLTLSNIISDNADERLLYRELAKVIDGQHRIEGLRDYEGERFQVNVSIFIGADTPDQAAIFSTVNLAQTKVNRSLVYDLFDVAKAKSPEKLAHNVVVALDRAENSPLHKRIKRLGTATYGREGSETLTQATVVSPLLDYISGSKIQLLKDRQRGLRRKNFDALSEEVKSKLVLRPFLFEDDAAKLADLLWNYFDAVKQKWPDAWDGHVERGMLDKTNGYNALMRFFRPVYLSLANPGDIVTKEAFSEVFEDINIAENHLNTQNYVPGSSGATALYNNLMEQSGLNKFAN